ncbi:g575 [Coccomyxa elongata]
MLSTSPTNGQTLDEVRKRKKGGQFCNNCGKGNHTSRQCQHPVISCGMLLYKRTPCQAPTTPPELDPQNLAYFRLDASKACKKPDVGEQTAVKFLLVRRRDSLDYVEFVRGKYELGDIKYLYHVFSGITKGERERLWKAKSFDEIWHTLWSRPETMLLNATRSEHDAPEWGFPKGRRNRRESDLDCAAREVAEETGIPRGSYAVIDQLGSVAEIFKGSNNIIYKHIYYIGCCPGDCEAVLDALNEDQVAEIGDIGWFTADEALQHFRVYDVEKRTLVSRLDNTLSHHRFDQESVIQGPPSGVLVTPTDPILDQPLGVGDCP